MYYIFEPHRNSEEIELNKKSKNVKKVKLCNGAELSSSIEVVLRLPEPNCEKAQRLN